MASLSRAASVSLWVSVLVIVGLGVCIAIVARYEPAPVYTTHTEAGARLLDADLRPLVADEVRERLVESAHSIRVDPFSRSVPPDANAYSRRRAEPWVLIVEYLVGTDPEDDSTYLLQVSVTSESDSTWVFESSAWSRIATTTRRT